MTSACICSAKIKYNSIIKKYDMFCKMLFLKKILNEKFNDTKTINIQFDYINNNNTNNKKEKDDSKSFESTMSTSSSKNILLRRVLFFGEIDFINAKQMKNYYYIQTIKEIFSILAYEEEQELLTNIRYTPYHKSKFKYSCYSNYIKYRILFGMINTALFKRSPYVSIYMKLYMDCIREIKLMKSIILKLHCNCKNNNNHNDDDSSHHDDDNNIEEKINLSLYDLITKSKVCEKINSCLVSITKFSIPFNIFAKFIIYKTCIDLYCYIE